MPLHFKNIRCALEGCSLSLDLSVEDGTLVGVTGPNGAGKSALLRLAAGDLHPDAGTIGGVRSAKLAAGSLDSVNAGEIRRSVDEAIEAHPDLLLIGPCFALTDPEYQHSTLTRFRSLQRDGVIIVLVSQDLTFLERYCDEVVVIENGAVTGHGDPRQVLGEYRERFVARQRAALPAPLLRPVSRHGDGRAKILTIEILRPGGEPAAVVESGGEIAVRILIEFVAAVENPVVGLLIRNRIGVNVYGTNTELEKVVLGPCVAGDRLEVRFLFGCHLCAEQYTLTVASHDPDGTAHEWLEEAIVFSVSDTRYTAGVANLRARVEVSR
jgi:ABC-type hemin transport system ATPase subunit